MQQTLACKYQLITGSQYLLMQCAVHSCTHITCKPDKVDVCLDKNTLVSPVQIFLEYILEGKMEVEEELPVHCRGRQVGWCSCFSLCCSCTPRCSYLGAGNRNKSNCCYSCC